VTVFLSWLIHRFVEKPGMQLAGLVAARCKEL